MIVEYVRYRISRERRSEFESAWRRAVGCLDHSSHCLAYEISHCAEDEDHYIVRIEWDSLEGHLEGFRKSAAFPKFFRAIGDFVKQIEEMRHYRLMDVRNRK